MNQQQQKQQLHYRDLAASYDTIYSRENSNHLYKIEEISRELFRALPETPRGLDLLEVGGGTGIHAAFLLRNYSARLSSFTLSDLSGEMLAQAEKRLGDHPLVKYLVTPAERLATEETFDGIFMSGAMHHFSAPAKSVEELTRHLRPGGALAVCEPVVWNPVNFVRAATARVDWGQFTTTRKAVRGFMLAQGLEVRCDRVLHWRAGSSVGRKLWPFDRLDAYPMLDPLAIMFLLVGVKR